ncbi:MAG TPA: family 1 glycosylhydrolase [Anaerolineales bacterium]|nr:family 1 glycosylhydrolase [Anaerolineales bacterium]
MAEARLTFPRDFLWGTATAAYQVEGSNANSSWHAWEQAGHIAAAGSAAQACDWWGGRWREDFDRAAETGQNAHRFSVEWSRIEPEPGRWDEAALDRYRDMARGLAERGLEPMATLHHFSDPLWLAETGGWVVDRTAAFEAFAVRVVEALKDHVRLWITFNEPNVYVTLGYITGVFPPGATDPFAAGRVMSHLLDAHIAAYHAIHRIRPDAQVGMAHHYRGMAPQRPWFPPDRWISAFHSRRFNEAFPRALQTGRLRLPVGLPRASAARGTQDFFGLNYYTSDLVRFAPFAPRVLFGRRSFPEDAEVSPNGFIANRPAEFARALRWAKGFGLPIYVTENGIEDASDRLRPRYLVEHLRQVWLAANFNWKIRGYFHWTLVDNFEWGNGWTQRFGLWELDLQTQARRMRPSAGLYAEICRANALSSEMVARYAPEVFAGMFPNE